ncbi:hypothetical protein D3C77_427170 [compost metagenome]
MFQILAQYRVNRRLDPLHVGNVQCVYIPLRRREVERQTLEERHGDRIVFVQLERVPIGRHAALDRVVPAAESTNDDFRIPVFRKQHARCAELGKHRQVECHPSGFA